MVTKEPMDKPLLSYVGELMVHWLTLAPDPRIPENAVYANSVYDPPYSDDADATKSSPPMVAEAADM
jgi:hypothetical protein